MAILSIIALTPATLMPDPDLSWKALLKKIR